ncbi:helix-turn-helix domain-containing protein [Mycobacterium sp. 155]|uniref:helix-turn-helix domain-containing protein n=1 Tax=Mycobacterium sp. 155 TaxID=1157943 RepID=UPI00037A5CE1|nr:helix-turn-helix domain-containing protein [Mycobacterium sp. 155]
MITAPAGVLLTVDDAVYALAAFEALLTDRHASPRLERFINALRKSVARTAKTGDLTSVSGVDARNTGVPEHNEPNPCRVTAYDLLDTTEAAAILGITPNAVRDLARRGRLPARRAGSRWLYPAGPVVERAERRAARKRG